MLSNEEIEEILAPNSQKNERISLSEAARRAGVTKGSVSNLLKRRPALLGQDGLLDAEEIAGVLETLKSSTRHQAQPKTQARAGRKSQPPTSELAAASKQKMTADARKAEAAANRAELVAAREAGELIDRRAVIETVTAIIAQARNRLLRLPDLLADELAHASPEAVHATLTTRINAVLRDLAQAVTNYDPSNPSVAEDG